MEKTYQIITDATADLNAELMQESGLEMLPMDVEIEGKRYSYAPVGGDLGEAEFYRALQAGKRASTSQINPLVYESCCGRDHRVYPRSGGGYPGGGGGETGGGAPYRHPGRR